MDDYLCRIDVEKFKMIIGSMKQTLGVQNKIKLVELPKEPNIVREFIYSENELISSSVHTRE